MNKLHLPKIPVLRTMHCEDHATFVAPYEHRDAFIMKWAQRGLTAMPAIVTKEFPAENIAMVERPGDTRTCERMIGLSVSTDPDSPINKLCELAGTDRSARGVLQHIAYSVEPAADFQEVRRHLEEEGVRFMTPILGYEDPNGAALRQMFVACRVPFGPFVEIIQRVPDRHGVPFQGFNGDQIDALYHHYDNYSRQLERA